MKLVALFNCLAAATASSNVATGLQTGLDGKLWFHEISEFWPGQALSLRVDKLVHSSHTELQEVLVFENEKWGTVFALDGAIQVTTLDEVSYQEVMAHTPMHLFNEGEVKRALVIGGGDGGVLRELAKYPEIEEIYICEIDGGVIEVAKKYLPTLAVGYDDERVSVFVQDGFQFLETMIQTGKTFDVIVSDLSDPIGPAESVFNPSFIRLLAKVLEPTRGVASLQGEAYWLHSELIKALVSEAQSLFPNVQYASIAIPTYPTGQIGALVMSRAEGRPVNIPVRTSGIDEYELHYYNQDLHRAQFVLPTVVRNLVYP